MKYRNLCVLICLIVFSISCSSTNSSRDYLNVLCEGQNGFSKDSVTRMMQYATVETDKYLSFDTLNVLSDTFRLRIDYHMSNQLFVFDVKSCGSFLSFKKYIFKVEEGRMARYLFAKQKDDKEKLAVSFNAAEKAGAFFNQLKKNRILELPDYSAVKGYSDEDESKQVYIQYSNKCRYKIIHYSNLHYFKDKFAEAKDVSEFMDYLKKEFD